jgi:hypothetical protein
MRLTKANLSAGAVLLALLLAANDAASQGMPRRDRGGSPRDSQSTRAKDAAPSPAQEPFSALERELPSLKVDMLLTAEQVAPWNTFERDVRDVAEMDRARRRHLMALRDGGETAPTAVTFMAALAEDERLKAEATSDLKRHIEVLYAMLDDKQRQTLDRRVVLSQTEPLGK